MRPTSLFLTLTAISLLAVHSAIAQTPAQPAPAATARTPQNQPALQINKNPPASTHTAAIPPNGIVIDTIVNIPVPAFRIKDLDGKEVALSDYKGKILVLDFWATWCQPCRQSFPAMQLTVDHYKNDPDVKFLFIDTREKTKDDISSIRTFLTQSNYTFNVALDGNGPEGNQDYLFKKYRMPGIPTKFIIDGFGIIRVKRIGYNPTLTTRAASDEFIAEIEKVRHPQLALKKTPLLQH